MIRAESMADDDILHLTAGEAAEIIRGIKPERACLTHFGMTRLRADPRKVAEKLSEQTGHEVLAAYDGLTVQL